MCRPNNKTQVSGNKCTEQDLFFYCVLIEVSVECLKKNKQTKRKRLIIWEVILQFNKDRVQFIKPRAVTKISSCKIYANYR